MGNARIMMQLAQLPIDMMGFIFYEKSPRCVVGRIAPQEIAQLPSRIRRVGVFVDETEENILDMAKEYGLDTLQLHGLESSELCRQLKEKGFSVIKAFHIDKENDYASYASYCDFFLFDTPTVGYGGAGVKFNWEKLSTYKFSVPFLLSGGIGPDDADNILSLKHTSMVGVDINSRFEISPGIKDVQKIKDFVLKVKQSKKTKNMYLADEKGYYGEFGGAFIPEMLRPNVDALQACYREIMDSKEFKEEYAGLLRDYVGRPSPLYFAKRLSEHYGAKIYLKREDLNHTGSHKINNAIGQILLAKRMGKTRIIAETGAGQHGVATATVAALMGLECIVYMGETDIKRQMPNVKRMEMLGAKVVPALSGNRTLKDATNEALRDWINNPEDTFYIIGSVVGPHPYPEIVAKFQSIISEEIEQQLQEKIGRSYPDYVLACVGGGSNAAGAFYHFLDNDKVKLYAVEASGLGIDSGETAATIARGEVGFIHGSKTMLMQDADGQIIEPYSISAGLDYPGIGPLHANLAAKGRATVIDATDQEALDAAYLLTQIEGIIPALESAHALAGLNKIKFQPDDVVVVNISGRGDKDMDTYIARMNK